MYMGVILNDAVKWVLCLRAPHVYGGDPTTFAFVTRFRKCSPCIWG